MPPAKMERMFTRYFIRGRIQVYPLIKDHLGRMSFALLITIMMLVFWFIQVVRTDMELGKPEQHRI
jgi:hypothetical protein